MTSARDLNLVFNRFSKEISSQGAKAKLQLELKSTSDELAEGSLEIPPLWKYCCLFTNEIHPSPEP